MDEILIEEKKYISSKQAAKITGYAKDYVGQLCREGRVPARLVGRSWYVLDSAIKDHRFGDKEKSKEESLNIESTYKTPEFPRYESLQVETLLSIDRTSRKDTEVRTDNNEKNQKSAFSNLNESWEGWFATHSGPTQTELNSPSTTDVQEMEEAVHVPIHTIHQNVSRVPLGRPQTQNDKKKAYKTRSVVIVIVYLLSILSVSFALLGSGYLDKYVISSTRASALAGIILYNK